MFDAALLLEPPTGTAAPRFGEEPLLTGAMLLEALDTGALASHEPQSRALRVLAASEPLRDALCVLPTKGGTSSRSGLNKNEWIEFLACVGDVARMNGL